MSDGLLHERPGQTQLLAVSLDRGSLWLLDPGAPDADIDFLRAAEQAWSDASFALPRSIPLLTRPLGELTRVVPRARHLATDVRVGHVRPARALDDTSFGLSFVLSLASQATGLPLPNHLVASAAVDSTGATSGVGGMEAKVACLARTAPHVRTLLVADGQQRRDPDAMYLAAGAGISVESVRHASQAIAIALPGIGARLAELANDDTAREALIESIYRLAIDSPNAGLVSWRVVAETAEHVAALAHGRCDGWSQWRLEASRAFASRHESPDAPHPCPWPAPDELALQPPPFRQYVAANIVQHAADCGTPPAREVLEWAEGLGFFPHRRDAFPADLRTLGARARLWAVAGRPEDALGAQAELTSAWIARGQLTQTTYTLSEWFRLAGALEDGDAFDAASRAQARVEFEADLGGGAVYVALARALAAARLGRGDEAASQLNGCWLDAARTPLYLRLQGQRILARVALASDDAAAAAAIAEGLRDTDPDTILARRLIELDVCIKTGASDMAREALAAIVAMGSQALKSLRAGRDVVKWPNEAEYVLRFFPY